MKTVLNVLIAVFVMVQVQVQAQQVTISGVVTDESGLPLPSVTVLEKGTSNGVSTDFDGNYLIQTRTGNHLMFSYIGYHTKKITVGNSTTINVSLEVDNESLEEVVISAYRNKRTSKALGYSVSSIQAESISRKENSNYGYLAQPLSGRVSGVDINNGSGKPGQSATIIIRGRNSINGNIEPLYIIDGVPVDGDNFKNLNANDIKSISVLKDASSTSIYGNRGINGTIIVNTKGAKRKTSKQKEQEQKNIIAQQKHLNESYTKIHENKFKTANTTPLSTFSIDVDKAGYSNVRRMLNNGQFVPSDAVKIEEMVNYFNYNYPQPTGDHPFSINTEVAKTPWNNDTKLVRIGLQGKTYENKNLPAANLTFLIDVSGSMSNQNKLPLLKSAFKLLVNQLREQDKVSIVVYAGAAGVVLKPTSGKHKDKIIAALDNLNAGGSTAGGRGIKLAYKMAEKNFSKKGNNRVILATDGDFNVGASSNDAMEKLIVEKRKTGVFLSVLGFGYGNYKDDKLETLADKGNGNHAYIDTMQEARRIFETEFGGTLFTIAKDVKIQVEFNPNQVQAYRLIGYENRLLADEDFVDDTKDAGELGAGHTVTALYEVVPVGVESNYVTSEIDLKYTKNETVNTTYKDELFTVKFRYKKPDGITSIEMVHIQKNVTTEASDDLNFASAVALFGMQLKQSSFHNNSKPSDVVALAEKGRGEDKSGYRVEFIRLISTFK